MRDRRPCLKCGKSQTQAKFNYLCRKCRFVPLMPMVSQPSCAQDVEAEESEHNLKVRQMQYQGQRWERLIKATDHIAPYKRFGAGDKQYLAAVQVCAAYGAGTLSFVPHDLLRMAAGRSVSHRYPQPTPAQVEEYNGKQHSGPV